MSYGPGDLLTQFQAAITLRRQREQQMAELVDRKDPGLAELQEQIQAAEQQHAADLHTTESQRAAALEALTSEHQSEHALAQRDRDQGLREIIRAHDAEAAALERQHNDSAWVVSSVMADDSDASPRRQHERYVHAIERSREDQSTALAGISNIFDTSAAERKYRLRDYEPEGEAPRSLEELQEQFQSAIAGATEHVQELTKLKLPRLFMSWRPAILFLLVFVAAAAIVYFAVDPALAGVSGGRSTSDWMMMSLMGGAVVAIVLLLFLYLIAMSAQNGVFRRWEQHLVNARALHQRWNQLVEKEAANREPQMLREQARVDAKREETLQRYRTTYETRIADIRSRKEAALAATHQAFRQRTAAADQLKAARFSDLTNWHTSQLESIEANYHSTIDALKTQVAGQMAERQREQSAAWSQLKLGWEESLGDFQSTLDSFESETRRQFPDWTDLAGRDVQRPDRIPAGIQLGHYGVDLHAWPEAISGDARLAPRRSELRIPAVLRFPERPSLLLKSRSAEGRAAALPILQTAMLRLLTALPPGTLRFTLIDPVGLGDSFAGFMHLADVDEMLVTSRIWTEPSQIEARLADLTEHMENVLQTYLRNEFPTLEDYNRHAGEVAEPYRIVVIRDFPSKFSEIAARRLTSIITSGPRCGVYVLMSVDGKLQLPNNFHLADIEPVMNVFEWNDPPAQRSGRFDWVHDAADPLSLEGLPVQAKVPTEQRPPSFYSTEPAFSRWPLVLEAPPEPEIFSQIVKSAGAAAKGARRVEVAFERIAPSDADRWTHDSRRGIDIPMGRAGAVKLQHVRLGQGTSQHMLIAGKTGSGKSTFLHGLITNLALHYSPNELQYFLIDFKKGVEFKDYARFHLPHARVIAIESDREFGVSALMRLDELMAERGELFRKHGAQDVNGFRNGNPNIPMPRILLVIDEFQEFFTEDDKYAQSAALLLDRLVRQGRAFGIHVVLGSQTLGGAYSLARSTLGQVAVRVALQCSEADAHLILSEDNTAARLLSRPGEAIYNDANGLVEGNHPFQIAWLPDDKRELYLRDLKRLSESRGLGVESPIVFEGNIPSDLAQNRELSRLLAGEAPESRRRTAPRIWLGDAVEIGDPTSVLLERQSSANILLVGQDAEAVQGILSAAAMALSAQIPDSETGDPSIYLFDGSAADDPVRELWAQLEQTLGSRFRRVAPNQAAPAIAELAAERERRDADRDALQPTICVLVYNLSRFRDLRRAEDDFGFGGHGGSGEQTVSPSRQFTQLLSSGPELGLHTIVWADSYNNVERWFSRQQLRDFELRILFPMNAADSSNLIDSPLASRLGSGRAILYREDRGSVEKFRPYAAPPRDWLAARFGEAAIPGEHADASQLSLDEFTVT